MIKKIALSLVLITMFAGSVFAETKDLIKIGGDAVVEEGVVVNDVVVIGGDLDIKGSVAGDAVVIFGDLTVNDGGRVIGNCVALFGKVMRLPGADISKKVFELSFGNIFGKIHESSCAVPLFGAGAFGVFFLTMAAGFLAIFLVIGVLFTGKVGVVSYYAEKSPLKSLYYGFLIVVLLAPLLLFLTVSIIGIPIIPIVVIVISAATLFGYASMCQLLGLRFFKALKKKGQPMIIEILVGFVIITFVVMIPVIGWMVKALFWMAGLGATAATRFGTKQA